MHYGPWSTHGAVHGTFLRPWNQGVHGVFHAEPHGIPYTVGYTTVYGRLWDIP